MVETSASSGFPMAVAYCHLNGWNGLKRDRQKVFDMLIKIEKEMNGYHWAQRMLGYCYEYGYGADKDNKKRSEYYSLSAEQGNSLAMVSLGYSHQEALETTENKIKALEWYEKSAKAGDSMAIHNVGFYYHRGWGGLNKDLNKAKEWYRKAVAQGSTLAQTELDTLNAQEDN